MISKIASFLARPWSIPVLVLLGMLLHAPGVNNDLFADDYLQQALFNGDLKQPHPAGSLFGLFNLVDGDPAHVQAMRETGRLAWSASDALRMSFWRPLAELTHWLDHVLWPDSPLLMHAHNLLWYGLLLLALGHLYRRLTVAPVQAGLATAIYAYSSLHTTAIAWLAARNQLMSALFTVLTVLCYHQWRSGKGARHYGLTALALVLALASAEASVAALCYLLAYALTLDEQPSLVQRLKPLLPFLLIVIVWRVVCTHLGYGSFGSGSYIDPVREPLRFAWFMMVRLPSMLLTQLFGAPSSAATRMDPAAQFAYAAMATTICLGVAWLIRRLGLWSSPHMRFYALGAVLALVPACAVAPQDRVLIHAEIGMSGVLSLLCCRVVVRWQRDRQSVDLIAKLTVGAIMIVHLVLFPVLSAAGAALFGPLLRPSTEGEIASLPPAAGRPDAHVVLINPPAPNQVFYYPLVREHLGLPNPKAMWALANGLQQTLTLEVVDAHSIRVSSPTAFVDMIHRDVHSQPFKPGDKVRLDMMTVVVEKVSAEGGPLVVRFDFDTPLQDPTWQFYVWRDLSYLPFALPAVGHKVELPAASLGTMVMQNWRKMTAQRTG
jgi:hypothetical protein